MQKNKKTLSLIILLTAFVCGIYVFSFVKNKNKHIQNPDLAADTFNITLVYPEIKDLDEQTKSAQIGIQAAIRQLNSGTGILNKKLNLTTINLNELNTLKTDPNFFSNSGIFIILGGDLFIKKAIETLRPLRKPLFYLGFGRCKTLLSKTDSSPTPLIYGLGLTWESTIEPLILHLIEKAYPQGTTQDEPTFSASYFTADMADERDLMLEIKTTAENLEVSTVSEQYFDIRIADYYPAIQKIISSRSSFLFVSNPFLAGQIFMQQAAQQSLTKDMLVAGLGTFEQEFVSAQPQATNGVITISPYYSEIKTPENDNFLKLFQEISPNQLPSEFAATAYGAVLLAAATYEKMNTFDNEVFDKEIKNIELNFPNGKVSINPDNNILNQEHFILKAENGVLKLVEPLAVAIHPKLSGCY